MKPEFLYDTSDLKNPEDQQLVGVVLNNDSSHCGLAYCIKNKDDAIAIHLENNNILGHDNNLDGFNWWIKPNINQYILDALVPLCEVINQKHNEGKLYLAYGLRYDEYAKIQMDGNLEYGKDGYGFTCATFVMTIFHSCGIDLVDIHNWIPRNDDEKFFKKVRTIFSEAWYRIKYNVKDEHAELMMNDIGSKRFRPEEIATSTALFNNGSAAPNEEIIAKAAELKLYILSQSVNGQTQDSSVESNGK